MCFESYFVCCYLHRVFCVIIYHGILHFELYSYFYGYFHFQGLEGEIGVSVGGGWVGAINGGWGVFLSTLFYVCFLYTYFCFNTRSLHKCPDNSDMVWWHA